VRSGVYRRRSHNRTGPIWFYPYRRCWCDWFNYRRDSYVRCGSRWWLWRGLPRALSRSLASRLGDTTPLSCNSKIFEVCHRADTSRSHGFFECHCQWCGLRDDQHLRLLFQLSDSLLRFQGRLSDLSQNWCHFLMQHESRNLSCVLGRGSSIARGSGGAVRMLTSLSESIEYPS